MRALGRHLAGLRYYTLLYVYRYNLIIALLNYIISISGDNYLIKDVDHGFLISVSYTGLKPSRNGPRFSEHDLSH